MKNIRVKAFTLVEVLVSITIFSIMIISIIWIYIVSSDVSVKSDINRIMQENLKHVSNLIAEDIRKNWIIWVSWNTTDTCNFDIWSNKYKIWDKLCLKSLKNYYLAKKDTVSWEYIRTNSLNCSWINDNCTIVNWISEPLTNSYISIKELKFYLSKEEIPKVTINIVAQPSVKKGVKQELIKENKIIFQTTISERIF